uniref:Potassium channel tetramerisation-type BTB domain-containing protein n=1 Tax=Ditylum brightwellii TaxID=49249 RepID=A0A7S4VIW2_9STRA
MSSNNLTNDNNNSNRDNAIIDLSVSGTTFTVPRSILTDRQWMLSNIASDHANSDEDIKTVPWGTFHNGKYFIDTDPKAFRWILHFIRHGSLPRGVFESSIEADALLDVADYLCYEELVTYICGERKEVMEYEERVLKLEREHSTKVKQMNKRYRELIKCVAMRARVDSMRRKFRGPVVGPLGAYLKIVEGKEHLAEIAETAIGHGLGHFVVTNGEDRALFMKLRQDVNCSSRECGVLQLVSRIRHTLSNTILFF